MNSAASLSHSFSDRGLHLSSLRTGDLFSHGPPQGSCIMKKTSLSFAAIGLLTLFQQACSPANTTAGFTCTATGTITSSGTIAANSTIQMNNISVTLINGGTGPFVITLPGLSPVESSTTTYNYANNITVATDSTGAISSQVSVIDGANFQAAVCTLTPPTPSTSSSGIQISAYPGSSAPVGTPITLTATTTDGTVNPVFTFTLASPQTGVTLNPIDSADASVTSTVATSVVVNVSETSSGSSTVVSSVTFNLYFTTASTTGTIQVSPSPSNSVSAGSSIVLTASDSSNISAAFSFVLNNAPSGVTLTTLSSTSAQVTSTGVATVVVDVSEYGSTNGPVQTTLYFTASTTASPSPGPTSYTVKVAASPSLSANTGNPISLTATSTVPNPVYTFVEIGTPDSGLSIDALESGFATVTSSLAASVTLEVTAFSTTVSGVQASTQVTLTFVGSSPGPSPSPTPEALSCTLVVTPGTYYPGMDVVFNITTNTGEPVYVTYWNPGEAWTTPPPYPLSPPVGVTYSYAGTMYVQMYATSATRPGMLCNGGAPLQATVTVNSYYYY